MRAHKNSYKKYLRRAKNNSLNVVKSIKRNPLRSLGVVTLSTGLLSGLIYWYKNKSPKHWTIRISKESSND